MKVGLCRDVLFPPQLVISVNKIATRLMGIWPPPVDGIPVDESDNPHMMGYQLT